MLKKFLCFGTILLFFVFLFHVSYATDIVMDLNATNATLNTTDNTIYSASSQPENEITNNTNTEYRQSTVTTTTDYSDSADLSISDMINIILIVVGVVLILLGIAIIIRVHSS